MKWRLAIRCLFSALLLFLSFTCAAAQPSAQQHRHVLLLHSYHKGMKWADDITESFTATLRAAHPDVEFHVEYMDAKRVIGEEHLANLYRVYRYKFGRERFALVATADDVALSFVLRHRSTLFPGVPVVFCGVNNFEPFMLDRERLVTGVIEDVDVVETLSTALTLHPGTRRLYVINDRTETGQGLHKRIAEALVPFSSRLSVTFLENLSVAELADIAAKLPPDSIVLRSVFFLDREGRTLPNEQDSFAAIDRHISVPEYSLWDFNLGLGIVGGKLVSGSAQGEQAARLAARILGGESADDIPLVTASPNRFMFDYRQLKRFGISRAALPAGSIVINAPRRFYAVSKPVIWTGILFTLTVTIAAGLLVNAMGKRQRAEAALRENEERLRGIFAASQAGIILVDPAGAIIFANERMAEMFGYTLAELVGMTYPALVHPAEKATGDRRMHDLIAGTIDRVDSERHYLRKDGSEFWGHLSGRRIVEADGTLRALVGIIADTTEHKAAEEALLRAEAKFRALFHSAGDAIFIHDFEGRIIELNERACERFSCRRDELVGRTITETGGQGPADPAADRMTTLRSEGRVIFETEYLRCDGSPVPVEVNAEIIDYEGHQAVMSVVRDITGRREVERLKEEMISSVSHDMRTPLTAILGYASFMLENDVPQDEEKVYLRTIYGETERLNELISNFLDLQRLKASQEPCELCPLELLPLLEEAVALFDKSSPLHRLVIDCPPDLPLVMGDADKLHLLLNNLVSNAIKYSPEGGDVVVGARPADGHVTVMVRDEGIGIPAAEQEKIFERFYRVSDRCRQRISGTGLGLALVREIAAAHHGSVWVESVEGQGTTFYLSLPVVDEGG